ncbi:hypothetical protein IAT38_008309 [Cryptococcus sp. DSM 104549]
MSSSDLRTILVFGATGKQGSGLIKALSKSSGYTIFAVTRDPTRDAAKTVSDAPNVTVVKGDVGDHEQLFKQPVYGVFFALFGFDVEASVIDAKRLIDSCLTNNVKHIVFTGVDFCGHREQGTGISFLDAKKTVEDYLIALPIQHTIIRPTGFMENLYMPVYKDIITTTWRDDIPYKWIAAADIGKIAAEVFEDPEKWAGKAIDICGESLTKAETVGVWKEVFGVTLQAKEAPKFPPGMATAMKFFDNNEMDADIKWNRENFPWLTDLKTWLKSSGLDGSQ